MPTNRFGELNTQPLYNATGRLERGEAVPRQEWTSPNAGVSKNFGATTPYPSQQVNPFVQDLANPWSYMNTRTFRDRPSRGGRGGGGSGEGEGGGNVTYNVYTNNSAQFGTQTQFDQSAGAGALPAPAGPKTRAPRTPEQLAETARKRAEKKAANPAYGTKNPNRTQAPKKPRAPKAQTGGPMAQGNAASANQTYSTGNMGGAGKPGAGFLGGGVGNINMQR